MGACCTKEARSNKLDAQEHQLGSLANGPLGVNERGSRPIAQTAPNTDDTFFFEQLAVMTSPIEEVNVFLGENKLVKIEGAGKIRSVCL